MNLKKIVLIALVTAAAASSAIAQTSDADKNQRPGVGADKAVAGAMGTVDPAFVAFSIVAVGIVAAGSSTSSTTGTTKK
ncbi:hypothetical protein [Rhodoferax lacus]|uniref:hypothetical protein n=1 Tax=Rhodoferax lacus TaxID=2184758 RepID=UPI00131454B4|nr:hypothetical protein [Rhodoferax lacus]